MFSTFTSFYFLCFYLALLMIYYIVPHKLQWIVLMIGSIAYFILACNGLMILYPLVTCFSAYCISMRITKTEVQSRRRLLLILAILIQIGILFVLKYVNFGINTVNGIAFIFGANENVIQGLNLLAPLGISFYTFSILGYVIDIYNGIVEPQKNPFKLLTYGMYFPNILSGPILRYREDAKDFFIPHPLSYKNLTYGLQRMLWGFFKTLVVSERLALVVNTVYGNPDEYKGIYVVVGTACFAFQLYSNFSGCMDIVLGMSETLGIKLPENFNLPFLSKTIAEYWRRWHITLGVWMKEYVFFPLLRTKFFGNLTKKLKNKCGKKAGKQLTTFIAMFILWFTVGIWHGGDWKYVIGSGLLHWLYIVLEEVMAPGFEKILIKIHINPQSKGVNAFRVMRTFLLVNIGFVFFRADSVSTACRMLCHSVQRFGILSFVRGGVFTLGLDWIEWVILLVSLAIMITGSILQSKMSIRDRLANMNIVVRWIILFAFLFFVIIMGHYGPGYSAAEFIYQGF